MDQTHQRLVDAAIRGDIDILSQLIKEDPYIIDRNYLNSEDKNVLHVSAMLGYEVFVTAVLQTNSSCPYHMCVARDRNGRNPIHVAAIHGRLNILNMIEHHHGLMHAALQKADRGGTILHLCVEYNQLDAMKLLLNILKSSSFVGAKNEDGMTILHQALECNKNQKRQEMITYLIENVAEIINIRNADKKTALDLFLEQARIPPKYFVVCGRKKGILLELEDDRGGIKESFHRSEARSGAEFGHRLQESLDKSKGAVMIVASIIATIAFQAMLNPPGGFWQDNSSQHGAGQSVIADTHPGLYATLFWFNTLAFMSSLGTIMMQVATGLGTRTHPKVQLYVLFALITGSIISISASYVLSIGAIAPKLIEPRRSSPEVLQYIVLICYIVVWILFMSWIARGQFNDRIRQVELMKMLRRRRRVPPV